MEDKKCGTIEDLDYNITEYETKMKTLVETNDSLHLQVKQLQEEIIEYQIVICRMGIDINGLTAARNHLQAKQKDYECDIKEFEKTVSEIISCNERLREELANEEKNNCDLRSEVTELTKEIEANKASILNLNGQLAEVQDIMTINKAYFLDMTSAFYNECIQKDLEIRFNDEEKKHLRSSVIDLQRSKDKKSDSIKKMQLEIDEHTSKYENLRRIHENYIKSIAETLLNVTEGVKDAFKRSGGKSENESSHENVEYITQTCDVDWERTVGKYLADLQAAVGRVVETAAAYRNQNDELESELLHKNDQIRNLELLIGPFREQLELYEQERQALSNVAKEIKKELEEIALQQAASLGLQNKKQKTKSLVQLKETNLRLKDEVNELQAKLRQKDRLIWKLNGSKDFKEEVKQSPFKVIFHQGISFIGKESASSKNQK